MLQSNFCRRAKRVYKDSSAPTSGPDRATCMPPLKDLACICSNTSEPCWSSNSASSLDLGSKRLQPAFCCCVCWGGRGGAVRPAGQLRSRTRGGLDGWAATAKVAPRARTRIRHCPRCPLTEALGSHRAHRPSGAQRDHLLRQGCMSYPRILARLCQAPGRRNSCAGSVVPLWPHFAEVPINGRWHRKSALAHLLRHGFDATSPQTRPIRRPAANARVRNARRNREGAAHAYLPFGSARVSAKDLQQTSPRQQRTILGTPHPSGECCDEGSP